MLCLPFQDVAALVKLYLQHPLSSFMVVAGLEDLRLEAVMFGLGVKSCEI